MLKQQEKHRAGAAAARVKLATARYHKSALDDAARVTSIAAGSSRASKGNIAAGSSRDSRGSRGSRGSKGDRGSRDSRGSNGTRDIQCQLSYSKGREAKGKERVKWQGGYHAAPSSPTQLPLTGR